MSDQEFGRFLARTAKEPELAKAFVLSVGDRQGEEAVQAVAAFAQAQGYEVSAADAAKARQALIGADSESRDLDDDELDGVDGGIVIETAIGVGLIGAALVGTGALGVGATAIAVGSLVPGVSDWFKQW